MLRRSHIRWKIGVAVLVLAAGIAGTAAATSAPAPASPAALPLPSPLRFVSNLDLECFRTTPYTPPRLPAPITLSHLNPVLAQQPAWQIDSIDTRDQLCTPVAKNGVIPPPGVLEFVQFVDLSCYRISGRSLDDTLVLDHLNPVLSHLPRKKVAVLEPEQLCLPVVKNDSVPPAEVLRLVRYIDLVCYRETPQVAMNESLKLTQLNKELSLLPTAEVRVDANRQLCVPVRKNNQDIPDDVLRIVRWIDLEKYDLRAAAIPTFTLKLRHINPLMERLPTEEATITGRDQLALPVAKNGVFPPPD
jgi:hypothetical protein